MLSSEVDGDSVAVIQMPHTLSGGKYVNGQKGQKRTALVKATASLVQQLPQKQGQKVPGRD